MKDVKLNRREFLRKGALLGAGALVLKDAQALPFDESTADEYKVNKPENIIYSSCLQCNTGCGIKCKLVDGILLKIDGNPYNPWTLSPHIPYKTDLKSASLIDGAICPKGQAGIQTVYDPYRIVRVLKRAGKRGENKWITISFEQAIKEICEGGKIFSHIPEEKDRVVEGLKDIIKLRDPSVSKQMSEMVNQILEEKDKDKKVALVAEFKKKFKSNLDVLIDPEHPDLGPKNNQIVLMWGRMKAGREDLYKRFAAALGTVNAHGHTTVCQGSLYFTCKALNAEYKEGKFGGGNKFYFQADLYNAKYVVFIGANLFEANYGPSNRSPLVTRRLVEGDLKFAVVDPRLSKLANKAHLWLPIKPVTDAALGMAVIRYLIESKSINERFLSAANMAAAKSIGEKSFSNGTWLVEVKDGNPTIFARASEIMIQGKPLKNEEKRKTKEGKEYVEKFLTVYKDGKLIPVDPNDDENPVFGDLFVDITTDDGKRLKSALQIIYEEARSKTIEEWSKICELDTKLVYKLCEEIARHRDSCAIDLHRGPAQHSNGFYNILTWMTVNILLGNIDHKGGMIKASTWDINGKGKLFDLKSHPGKISSFGLNIIRSNIPYEKTTIFRGYPAKRNFYPLASDVYEEIIPSAYDQYPYPIKALFLYMGSPVYSLPAGHKQIEALKDINKIPLIIASDILVGTTSIYADYIFPDLSYLERWEFQGSHPNIPFKVQNIRQPVISPLTEKCTVYGYDIPISFEAMILKIAEFLNLPGFGKDAFGKGLDLKHPDDLYLRQVANVAFGEKEDASQNVPDADDNEVEIFIKSHRHIDRSMFDVERIKRIVGDKMFRKVVYVLNRGGRFEDYEKAFIGEYFAHPYAALLNIYQEKTYKTIHSGTGKHLKGYATYIPVADYLGREPIELKNGYDLHMITNRTILHTKSRTISNYYLQPMMPENEILINSIDAKRYGLKKGDFARIVSYTNAEGVWDISDKYKRNVIGRIRITETVKPGIITFVLGFGHWATGGSDIIINGEVIKGDARRAAGFHANSVMWVDPYLKNTCFIDPVGGSVGFYDTFVKLVRI
jgi:anaerobic selenocysteine-containing dehydrogenase